MGDAPKAAGAAARVGERAIDLALAAAERDFGMGRSLAAPGWVRDRVLSVLDAQAARRQVSLLVAAERLAGDRDAVEEIVAALRVGETRLYRDPMYWEAIAAMLPRLPPEAPIAGLSAGCSTGEEAYTLGMVLASAGRRFSVLGVDRSRPAIEAARDAVYAADGAEHMPRGFAARFCDLDGAVLRVRKELRAVVTFEVCDLIKDVPRGGFHFILFKNVLLYLAAPAGEAVARRLAAELAPGGLLLSAASEVPRLRGAGLFPVRLSPNLTAFRGPGA